MADYIPEGAAAFDAWLDNSVTYANANLARFLTGAALKQAS